MREMWGVLLEDVARCRNRAFCRQVTTSSGSWVDTDGELAAGTDTGAVDDMVAKFVMCVCV